MQLLPLGNASRTVSWPDACPSEERASEYSTWTVDARTLEAVKRSGLPAFVLNLRQLRKDYQAFASTFAGITPHYSIKTNTDPRVLATLRRLGARFEAVAHYEVEYAMRAGSNPHDIIYSGPVKRIQDIQRSYEAGIRVYVAESLHEIDKLVRYAPGSKVLIRLEMSDPGARIDLSTKYGIPPDETLIYLSYVRRSGLIPYGLSFHVGGQNENPRAWSRGVSLCHELIDAAREHGFDLRMVNIGGGFPIPLHTGVPLLEAIADQLPLLRDTITYVAEPGRIIVSESGKLVFPIVSHSRRKGRTWLYIDGSIYGSLFMMGGHRFTYPITTDCIEIGHEDYTIASMSCDGTDIISKSISMKAGITNNHVLIFHLVGAYSLPTFNVEYAGISKMATRYLDDPCVQE